MIAKTVLDKCGLFKFSQNATFVAVNETTKDGLKYIIAIRRGSSNGR